MQADEAYREAERRIEEARQNKTVLLSLFGLQTSLPDSICKLTKLQSLYLQENQLTTLPADFYKLTNLQSLSLRSNQLTTLPEEILKLTNLQSLSLSSNQLTTLPADFHKLTNLQSLSLRSNQLTTLPADFHKLTNLQSLYLDDNPLQPDLLAAYNEGLDALMRYLRAQAEAQLTLNEAKLILVGEGEVGKSCLLAALRGDPWEENKPTTHGIDIKPTMVVDEETGTEITMNCWDFGGQKVYRPTHQLFFSAPAVYLVVWKPREGIQQNFVKEWIELVLHREPDAKILVVATHGGPKERQGDIDRQEYWDLFGRESILGFYTVESKPNKAGERKGIADLKTAIARVATQLPGMPQKVPKSWNDVREALSKKKTAYIPLDTVIEISKDCKMGDEEATDFIRISHRLGHLIHYEHDQELKDIVILKPDWIATAISYVLDDEDTRDGNGLITFDRLSAVWQDPARPKATRYPAELHPAFVRIMERFDLSYRIPDPNTTEVDGTSLIAQLVPDIRPEDKLSAAWPDTPEAGDQQQTQICHIVSAKTGESKNAEGLFYQLIVRLHRFSLGRANFCDSVHWQRGLVLDDGYNGRALLEHRGNDIRITVRAPYPEGFLGHLTYEVKWLIENFWEGLRCDIMVPCTDPCGKGKPGTALFNVEKLYSSKRQNRTEFPCPMCDEWKNIDDLLRNAPVPRKTVMEELLEEFVGVKKQLVGITQQIDGFKDTAIGRFDQLDENDQRILSKVDDAFDDLIKAMVDEAKDGPRLFSMEPVEPGFLDRPKLVSTKYRITLWCEHSRLPLPMLNGQDDKRGVYEITVPCDWLVKSAPTLKVITGVLGLVLPVAASATKLVLDDAAYKGIEKQLELGQNSFDALLKGSEIATDYMARRDAPDFDDDKDPSIKGPVLRQLHAWLKEKDPRFGGLIRVRNKRNEFWWVHRQFKGHYL